jgi:hypothetical protein
VLGVSGAVISQFVSKAPEEVGVSDASCVLLCFGQCVGGRGGRSRSAGHDHVRVRGVAGAVISRLASQY